MIQQGLNHPDIGPVPQQARGERVPESVRHTVSHLGAVSPTMRNGFDQSPRVRATNALALLLGWLAQSHACPRISVFSSVYPNSNSLSAGCIGMIRGRLPLPTVRIVPGEVTPFSYRISSNERSPTRGDHRGALTLDAGEYEATRGDVERLLIAARALLALRPARRS
jgi:hypothetical protein